MNITEKLLNIQNELKAPKNQRNTFGNYNYRSCEDILEAVKPLCLKHKCTLVIEDNIIDIPDSNMPTRLFVKATAILIDCESEEFSSLDVSAFAEIDNHKGMSKDQCTGTASSYARKYALNGLFAIDDAKDADTDEVTKAKKTTEKKETTINETQAKTIEDLIVSTNTDKAAFLTYYKVNDVKELTTTNFKRVLEVLNKKEKGDK